MKTKIKILILTAALVGACTEEAEIVDPIYEFVAFVGNSEVNLNEFNHSTKGYPMVVQLWAFAPYAEDIQITTEVAETSADQGVDFSISPTTLTVPAGKLTSDTLWITTINNASASASDRLFSLTLKTASKSDLKIGLGLNEHRNATIAFTILDDECSMTTAIYNSTMSNNIGGYTDKPATGTLAANELTVVGDLIDYTEYTLKMTLTPAVPGGTKGTATFGNYYAGIANDGYEYRFIQVGTGTYDVCSGTIEIEYDIEYVDGGNWVYWFTTTNVFSVQ